MILELSKAFFFCHSLSVKLLTNHHFILFLDCTYKTNKYRMPLLHIAGITGANKSFSVAFCFLAEETQDYYNWALQTLLTIFTTNKIPLPDVVLTNCEQALINSLSTNLPDATHMLCTWHIQKNLVTNAAKFIKNKEKEAAMIQHWNNIIRITTIGDFRSAFKRFVDSYGDGFCDYMTSNWLLVAEKYANAWTKDVVHFDHRTMSRIESSHSYIKSHLLGPNLSLPAVIKSITNAREAQYHKITGLYHQQKINSLRYLGQIFENCHGKVTHFALRKAQNKFTTSARLEKGDKCNGCYQIRTGMPCKHRLCELALKGAKV